MSRRICHEISWIVLRTKIKLTHRLYHAKVRDEHNHYNNCFDKIINKTWIKILKLLI